MTLTELQLLQRHLAIATVDAELKKIGGQISGAKRRKDYEAAARLEQLRDAARERLFLAKAAA
jgi:hypothetical protein